MKRGLSDDMNFMSNGDLWPGLLLPIKRVVDGRLECAYLLNPTPVIYFGSIFTATPADPKKEYSGFNAIIADGWRVD